MENLCFVIKALVANETVVSGIYEVADPEALSTNRLVALAGHALEKKVTFIKFPKGLVRLLAKLGNTLPLPLNTERLEKLTENAVVDSNKLIAAIGKPFPQSTRAGFMKTFESFINE